MTRLIFRYIWIGNIASCQVMTFFSNQDMNASRLGRISECQIPRHAWRLRFLIRIHLIKDTQLRRAVEDAVVVYAGARYDSFNYDDNVWGWTGSRPIRDWSNAFQICSHSILKLATSLPIFSLSLSLSFSLSLSLASYLPFKSATFLYYWIC